MSARRKLAADATSKELWFHRTAPTLASADSFAYPSPVLALHERLAAELGEAMPDAERWSARTRVILIVGSASVLWISLFALGSLIF